MKYEVHWISGTIDKTHGVFDTLKAAQDSVIAWWKKNDYEPPYIRVVRGDMVGLRASQCLLRLQGS